jgi:hypothetical protein
MSVGRSSQGERAVHDRLETRPAFKPVEPVFAKTAHHLVLFRLRTRFQVLQREANTSAPEDADLDEPAAAGKRSDIPGEIRCADKIDAHVDAVSVRRLRRDLGEVLHALVDDHIRSQLCDALDLACVGGGKDQCSCRVGKLHGRRTDCH